MKVLENYAKLRGQNNRFYKNVFKNIVGIFVFSESNKNYFSNHWLSCILVDSNVFGKPKEAIRLALAENNIECRMATYFQGLPLLWN